MYQPIADCYGDQSVLITGGTGFLGKVLLEKLLYSCPRINKIYILIREKPNISIETRLKLIFQQPLFQRIRNENPEALQKVIPIKGDVSIPGLGIEDEEKQLLIDTISRVFHLAATINFNESLNVTLNINVDGTERVLNLCKSMKKIKSFVYVSTAYSNADRNVIEEKIYPEPFTLDKIKKLIDEGLNEDQIEVLIGRAAAGQAGLGFFGGSPIDQCLLICFRLGRSSGGLLSYLIYFFCSIYLPMNVGDLLLLLVHTSGKPNVYTFTKAIAENVVAEGHVNVPIVIVRPSIVSSSITDPLRGWIDNWYGATALIAAAGKGINRVVHTSPNNVLDLIPVDYVANTIIVAAARYKWSKDVAVYNSSSSRVNPLRMQNLGDLTIADAYKHKYYDIPLPFVRFTPSKLTVFFISLFMELIPAYIADFYLSLFGKNPRYVKAIYKLHMLREKLRFFIHNNLIIKTKNTSDMARSLSLSDKRIFPFNPIDIDWDDYIPVYCRGIKEFLLKK